MYYGKVNLVTSHPDRVLNSAAQVSIQWYGDESEVVLLEDTASRVQNAKRYCAAKGSKGDIRVRHPCKLSGQIYPQVFRQTKRRHANWIPFFVVHASVLNCDLHETLLPQRLICTVLLAPVKRSLI